MNGANPGGGVDTYTNADALGFIRPNLDNTQPAGQITIDRWFNKQRDLNIPVANRFNALECQELHRLGYDPEDLLNGADLAGQTAGHINVKNPVAAG